MTEEPTGEVPRSRWDSDFELDDFVTRPPATRSAPSARRGSSADVMYDDQLFRPTASSRSTSRTPSRSTSRSGRTSAGHAADRHETRRGRDSAAPRSSTSRSAPSRSTAAHSTSSRSEPSRAASSRSPTRSRRLLADDLPATAAVPTIRREPALRSDRRRATPATETQVDSGRPSAGTRAAAPPVERWVRLLVIIATAFTLGGLAAVATQRDTSPQRLSDSGTPAPVVAGTDATAPADGATVAPAATEVPDLAVAEDPAAAASATPQTEAVDSSFDPDGCTIAPESMKIGDSGNDVKCLQGALSSAGFYSGALTGSYDQATANAVTALQTDKDLFVDGVAGRETGKALEIWPDEQMFVVRTPPPAPGAVDLDGFKLSPVASAGDDAPPLPANSGSGKRVVYERLSQRVWAVDADGQIVRSYLVTGSQYNNEMPGTHTVYSRSEQSTAWNGRAILPMMIRYQKTQRGAIGFHGIPIHVSDGTPYQTDAELGTRLSGGCQRQNNLDATFLWHFATVGTTVVVL